MQRSNDGFGAMFGGCSMGGLQMFSICDYNGWKRPSFHLANSLQTPDQ